LLFLAWKTEASGACDIGRFSGIPYPSLLFLAAFDQGPCVALSVPREGANNMGEGIYFLLIGVFLIVGSLVARRYS
jgi:hypothetical protein